MQRSSFFHLAAKTIFMSAFVAGTTLSAAVLRHAPDTYVGMIHAHREASEQVFELTDSGNLLSADRREATFALLASNHAEERTVSVHFSLEFPDGKVQNLDTLPPLKLRQGKMLARNLTLKLEQSDLAHLATLSSNYNLIGLRVKAIFSDETGSVLSALNDTAAIGFDRGTRPQPPNAVVSDDVTGVPTLTINGTRYPGVFGYVGWNWQVPRRTIRDLGAAGRHLYEIVFQPWSIWKNGRLDPDVFEHKLNSQVAAIVAHDPEALIFVRWWLYVPRDWSAKNPAGKIVFDDGSNDIRFLGAPMVHASYASREWKRDYTQAVQTAVERLCRSPYADRIFMIRVGYGNCGEWNNFGYHDSKFPGYSEQMTAEYRSWLRARYQDVAHLNRAHHTSYASFDAVPVPGRGERMALESGIFRSPQTGANVRDFYRFFSEYTVGLIEHFGKIVKAASGNRLLYGVFYGYFTHHLTAMPYHFLDSGHYALGKLLRVPEVDTLCSPYNYYRRDRNITLGMPLESIKAHGKLFLTEIDLPTHLADAKRYQHSAGVTDPYTREEELTLTRYRRDFGRVLTWGVGGYWYDFAHNWYCFDRFRKFAAETAQINREAAEADLKSIAEIALFLDEESIFDVSLQAEAWGKAFRENIAWNLERTATPFDTYLSSDLDRALKRGYKLLIFANQFRQNPEIADRLRDYPGTVLFLQDAGVITPDSRLVEQSDFYGIPIRRQSENAQLRQAGNRLHWPATELPLPIWREVLTRAGIHRYTETDDVVIYANASFLGVWIPEPDGSEIEFRLPAPAELTDTLEGTMRKCDRFRLKPKAGVPFFRLFRTIPAPALN